MNDIFGVAKFMTPVAAWLLLAMLAEVYACRKTGKWNERLIFASATLVLSRVYWIVWITTMRVKDLTDSVDHDTQREKLLANLFLFIMATFFLPQAALMFGRIWSERKNCGALATVLRAVPACALSYLFVSFAVKSFLFVASIQTSL